jgi:phosphatidylserine/phosphatidylglycerophosphate/cardiolipin synthase-like enzyme
LLIEPDDGADPVLAIVRNARRSIRLEMYLLTDEDAIQALLDGQQRGLDVAAILEPHPFESDGANQPAYDRLVAAGAAVTWASPRFALTHAKLLLADGQRAGVLSLNLTHAGLTSNREYAVVDDDPTDLAGLAAIFAADQIGVPAPALAGSARLLASPDNARSRLADLVAGARRTLAVEMEELSDPDLVDGLVSAVARAVAVTVVLPASGQSAATSAAARSLSDGGVSVRLLASPTLHAKAMVADGARVYVGSVNLTTASLDHNREIGIMLDDGALAGEVARTISADWARGGEL